MHFRSIRPALPTRSVLLACLTLGGAFSPLVAQQPSGSPSAPVKLSAVLTAFLVDSGVRTRGLDWTTGSELPITWNTPGPVPNQEEYSRRQGVTQVREGKFTGTSGDSVALTWSIKLNGTPAGLQGVALSLESMAVTRPDGSGFYLTREMVEKALRDEGLTLQPIKCKRETEGASYGNLVDAVRAPGKTASGLWWFWQCPQQECTLSLTILYRRTDLAQVECVG